MKKTLKRNLIGLATLFVVLIVALFGFYLKMKSELKEMQVTETKEIVSGVYAIKDSFVNMFLLKDSNNYIAVDAGKDKDVIAEELKKLSINPQNITAVILTHCDGDHTAALELFKHAKIYFSTLEEQMINGKTSKMLFFHNGIYTKDYNLLTDNQLLTIGNLSIKTISTPGHTPGSMSYLINDRYLFVGDAFGLKNGKITRPNSFFSKDMSTAVLSFEKIKNLPAEYIFTAHAGYTNDYKNAVNVSLKSE